MHSTAIFATLPVTARGHPGNLGLIDTQVGALVIENLSREEALELLKLSIREVHDFYSAYNSRITWFTSIISALLLGILVGFIRAEQWYHYLLLIIVPICIFGVCRIALDSIYLAHRYMLEAITSRAKYEQYLGLDRPPKFENEDEVYWANEGFVPSRYLERKKIATSEEWVNSRLDTKDRKNWWPIALFQAAQGIAIFLVIVLLVIGLTQAIL